MTRLSLLRLRLRPRRAGSAAGSASGASAGQILVLFALMLTALFGILGLAIDVGYAVAQRRTVQNAADLAAIAGAHTVAEYRSGVVEPNAWDSVERVIEGNKTVGGDTPETASVEECVYVDDFDNEPGDCRLEVPTSATGVRVVTSETHDTFFIRVVPGAPQQVTTSATATARVELLFRAGQDAPFLVCGFGAKLAGGGEMDILLEIEEGGRMVAGDVNPAAIGQTFRIVGKNFDNVPPPTPSPTPTPVSTAITGTTPTPTDTPAATLTPTPIPSPPPILPSDPRDEIADCGIEGPEWTGHSANGDPFFGQLSNDHNQADEEWFGRPFSPAVRTQRFTLNGVNGCFGTTELDLPAGEKFANAGKFGPDPDANCLLALPIATDAVHAPTDPGSNPDWHADYRPTCETASSCRFWVVKVLTFKIAKLGPRNYTATLIDDYPAYGGAYPGWQREAGATVVIKLQN